MKPILTVIHLYEERYWPEFACLLKSIVAPFDLYVMMVAENDALKQRILNDYPKATVQVVENRGFESGTFFHVLSNVCLDDYSYVIKLHAKRKMGVEAIINGFNMKLNRWHRYTISFLKNKDTFRRILAAFEQDQKLGMVGDYHLILNREEFDPVAVKNARAFLKQMGLPEKSVTYIAGTVFICRSEILKPIQALNLKLSDFEPTSREQKTSLAHTVERLFGMTVAAMGYEIKDVFTPRLIQGIALTLRHLGPAARFFYRKKETHKSQILIKICKIPILVKRSN